MIRRFQLFLMTIVLIGVSGCASHAFHGTLLDPPSQAPAFTLTDHNEQAFRLSDLKGKLVLLYFGFTSCPDICPTELSSLAALRRELGSSADGVQVVMVTVDPERDTTNHLRQYVTAFDPTFIGLTGSQAELQAVFTSYGVIAKKHPLADSALGYTMDHSAFVYVIDQTGRWVELFPMGTPTADALDDVRYLLQSRVN